MVHYWKAGTCSKMGLNFKGASGLGIFTLSLCLPLLRDTRWRWFFNRLTKSAIKGQSQKLAIFYFRLRKVWGDPFDLLFDVCDVIIKPRVEISYEAFCDAVDVYENVFDLRHLLFKLPHAMVK